MGEVPMAVPVKRFRERAVPRVAHIVHVTSATKVITPST